MDEMFESEIIVVDDIDLQVEMIVMRYIVWGLHNFNRVYVNQTV